MRIKSLINNLYFFDGGLRFFAVKCTLANEKGFAYVTSRRNVFAFFLPTVITERYTAC